MTVVTEAAVAQWLSVLQFPYLPVANFLKPEKRLQALADLALASARDSFGVESLESGAVE